MHEVTKFGSERGDKATPSQSLVSGHPPAWYFETLCLEYRHRYPRFSAWGTGSAIIAIDPSSPKGAVIYSYIVERAITERKEDSEARSSGFEFR